MDGTQSANQGYHLAGTLTDAQIRELCSNNKLIVENFEERNIKQCCYELTAGNIYYELGDKQNPTKQTVQDSGYILIKPRQNVVIITKEVICLENDMLGRILSKGKLFSIGLLPVNTYADPGFDGNLGIVFYNSSHEYIKIFPNETIAKIEFSKLAEPVARPYNGQHGYQTKMWPIPVEMLLSDKEIKNDDRIGPKPDELEISYGKDIADVYRELVVTTRSVIISSCIFFIAMILLIAHFGGGDKITTTVSIFLGIVSNLIVALLTFLVTRIRRRAK